MSAAFLVTLREGLEAALITGILMAYLARTGHTSSFKHIWLGVAAAILVSLGVGAGLYWTLGALSGRAEQLFEGSAMFVAVAILTYMVIWMKRQAVNIKGNLEAKMLSALAAGSALAMVSLAFVVVVREGIETSLFMLGVLTSTSAWSATTGGLLGLAIATAIGYAGYKGAKWLNLSTFFSVTRALLIFFSAGLLAHGIHEFQEAGVFPVVIEHVWNTNGFLNENNGFGSFLKALFGYNGNPELLELCFYFTYMASALWYFYKIARSSPRKKQTGQATAPNAVEPQPREARS